MSHHPRVAVRRALSLLFITAVVAPLAIGCMGAIPSNPSRPATSKQRPATGDSAAFSFERGGTGPVSRLRVNGETIEAAELWKGLKEELSAKAASLAPDAYATYVQQQAARLIADKIAEMLLYQRAALRLPSEVKDNVDKYVDQDLRRIVTAEYEGVQRRHEKALAARGQTIDDMRTKLHREIMIAGYLERDVKPKVAEPTRAELLAAFEAEADSYRRPAQRSMSLIDVRIRERLDGHLDRPKPEQREAAKDQARSRAETARTELASGAPFADVARRYSDGLHAAEGGVWGWVSRGTVRERFEPAVDALYQLEAGAVSDVIETDDGFFLVRCDQIDPGANPDFQSLQPQLVERHFRNAYNRLIAELVEELRTKARIEPADLSRFHAAVVNAAP